MASLLHQAALQPPLPHPWAQSSTSSLSLLPHATPSKLRRAPHRRIQAAGTPVTDSAAGADTATSTAKKTTRKEKQQERRRQREQEEVLQRLLAEAASPAKDGGVEYDEDEIPQPVFDRMLRRILFAVGIPMASGVALLNVYDALKRGQGVEVPSWLPLLTILVAFGTSALGIAYGTLSASWDPDKEGSLLGIDEAIANWPVLWKEEIDKEKAKKKKK